MVFARRQERGFTLIEVIVVAAILGILVTIVVATYASSQRLVYEAADRSNLRILRTAVDRYVTEEQHLPAELDDLYPDFVSARRPFSTPDTRHPYEYDPLTGKVSNPDHPDR